MKLIYLDVCVLSRPFDDQSFLRIRLETDATNLILAKVKAKEYRLINELGPIEANRFISMPRKKRIESVKRHREWQKNLDKDTFFKEVFNIN